MLVVRIEETDADDKEVVLEWRSVEGGRASQEVSQRFLEEMVSSLLLWPRLSEER